MKSDACLLNIKLMRFEEKPPILKTALIDIIIQNESF